MVKYTQTHFDWSSNGLVHKTFCGGEFDPPPPPGKPTSDKTWNHALGGRAIFWNNTPWSYSLSRNGWDK